MIKVASCHNKDLLQSSMATSGYNVISGHRPSTLGPCYDSFQVKHILICFDFFWDRGRCSFRTSQNQTHARNTHSSDEFHHSESRKVKTRKRETKNQCPLSLRPPVN